MYPWGGGVLEVFRHPDPCTHPTSRPWLRHREWVQYCYIVFLYSLNNAADNFLTKPFQRYDVTPPRAVRKVIFGLRLWRPIRQRNRAQRHGIPSRGGLSHTPPVRSQSAVFGCLNIRSLLNKFDDVVELCRDRHIDLLCVTESWHDADSAVLGRLRCSGFNVVDRPRPRVDGDNLSVNHGGVVVIAATDVALSPIVINDPQPTTFEVLCVRAVIGQFSAVVVTLYRPGSAAIQQTFFDELAVIFDQVATYQEPIYVVGDFNIRLDRPDNPHADQLRLLAECYGLVLHDTGQTHQLGGTLDAVITHEVTGRPSCVTADDVGLSDHFLLRWEISTTREASATMPVCARPWRRLDIDQFRSELSMSRLCRLDEWPDDVDELAALYTDELNCVLDRVLPEKQFVRRQRPSDPWFDKECRDAKRLTRRLERAFSAANSRAASATKTTASSDVITAVSKAAAAKAAWYAQRRTYRQLRRRKCTDFWRGKIEANESNPRQLWRVVDTLLGRGRIPPSSAIDVEVFSQFAEKVSKVRSSTSDALQAAFSHVQPGVSVCQ